MTPDRDGAALARHLNQRTIAAGRLDADPVTLKLGTLRAAAVFKLNHQLAALQNYFFAVARMPRINQKSRAYRHQLQPSKGQDKSGTLRPEQSRNTERHHAK